MHIGTYIIYRHKLYYIIYYTTIVISSYTKTFIGLRNKMGINNVYGIYIRIRYTVYIYTVKPLDKYLSGVLQYM